MYVTIVGEAFETRPGLEEGASVIPSASTTNGTNTEELGEFVLAPILRAVNGELMLPEPVQAQKTPVGMVR